MIRATLHEQEIRRTIEAPGEGELVVDGVAPLGATEDRCLYFINSEVTAAARDVLSKRSGCIVIAPLGSALAGQLGTCGVLEAADPRAAIAKVLALIQSTRRQAPWVTARRVSPRAVISPLAVVEGDVDIGDDVVVEPFCTVAPDVSIGRGSILRAGARVYSRVSIGEESVIGANTVVGHDGYGFVRDDAGHKTRIPHLGGVLIGSHVDIGALVVVQSGAVAPTVVEDYAKIDDNVEVGHGCRVAAGASVTGGVVIGGSAVIGEEAWVGINCSIRDGRRVGARALVGMDVSVQEDLADDVVARAAPPAVAPRPPDDSRSAIGFAGRPARRPV